MSAFDDSTRKIVAYASSLRDAEISRAILVKLVKEKAKYRREDLFELFFNSPYSGVTDANRACMYLALIPVLQKLYDKASASGKRNGIKLGAVKSGFGENCAAIIDKIKRL